MEPSTRPFNSAELAARKLSPKPGDLMVFYVWHKLSQQQMRAIVDTVKVMHEEFYPEVQWLVLRDDGSPRDCIELIGSHALRERGYVRKEELDATRAAFEGVLRHWREFGPEHGFEEVLERNAKLAEVQGGADWGKSMLADLVEVCKAAREEAAKHVTWEFEAFPPMSQEMTDLLWLQWLDDLRSGAIARTGVPAGLFTSPPNESEPDFRLANEVRETVHLAQVRSEIAGMIGANHGIGQPSERRLARLRRYGEYASMRPRWVSLLPEMNR